jgi:hypothetical protein
MACGFHGAGKALGVLESAAYRKICEHLQNVAQRRITARGAGDEKRRIRPSAKAHGALESAAYRKICEHLQGAVQRRITA